MQGQGQSAQPALFTFYKQKYENVQIITTQQLPNKLQSISVNLKPIKSLLNNQEKINKLLKINGSKNTEFNHKKISKLTKIRCKTQVLVNQKSISNSDQELINCGTNSNSKIQYVFQTDVKIEQKQRKPKYCRNYEQVMLLTKCLPLTSLQREYQSKTMCASQPKFKSMIYQPYGLLKKKYIDQKRIKTKSNIQKQHNKNQSGDIRVEWKSVTRQNSTILSMIKFQQKNNVQNRTILQEQRYIKDKLISSKSMKLVPIQRTKSILCRLKAKNQNDKNIILQRKKSLERLFAINDVSFVQKTQIKKV